MDIFNLNSSWLLWYESNFHGKRLESPGPFQVPDTIHALPCTIWPAAEPIAVKQLTQHKASK